jgi:hypothetical protein
MQFLIFASFCFVEIMNHHRMTYKTKSYDFVCCNYSYKFMQNYTYYVYQQATDWAMYYLYFKRFRENSLTFFLENVAARDNKNQFVLHKFVWIIATDKIITFGFICHSVMIHDFNKAKRSKNEKLHVSTSEVGPNLALIAPSPLCLKQSRLIGLLWQNFIYFPKKKERFRATFPRFFFTSEPLSKCINKLFRNKYS